MSITTPIVNHKQSLKELDIVHVIVGLMTLTVEKLKEHKQKKRFRILRKKSVKSKVYDLDRELDSRNKPSGALPAIKNKIQAFKESVHTKQNERLTVMFIPHNEKSIKNYHISNLSLTILLGCLTIIIVASSFLIINHTSTVQEVGKLKLSKEDAKLQFKKIRTEIRDIAKSYNKIRNNLSDLYSLSKGKENKDSLFGQGGISLPLKKVEEQSNVDQAEKIPIEIFMLKRVLNDMEIAEKPLNEIEDFIKRREKVIQNTPTLWPIKGYIINPYGFIRHANKLYVVNNAGVDIAANPGSEVIASAPGVIRTIKQDSFKQFTIKIQHNYGYTTVYSGLERVNVKVDSKVTKGDALGYLGISRNGLDSILHYEIRVGIDTQDPLPYLSYITN